MRAQRGQRSELISGHYVTIRVPVVLQYERNYWVAAASGKIGTGITKRAAMRSLRGKLES